MNPREVASNYLRQGLVMQLGTLYESTPRVNSLYFVASPDNLFIYWMSEPRRRHSVAIEKNPRVAAAIAIKAQHPVAGLQLTGIAKEVIEPEEIKKAAQLYNQKYPDFAVGFYERYVAGKNKNRVYKMTIDNLELFDDVHFPGGETVTIALS